MFTLGLILGAAAAVTAVAALERWYYEIPDKKSLDKHLVFIR